MLTINVLGPVEIVHDGTPIKLYRQEARALAMLIAARGRAVSQESLTVAIWQDESLPAPDGLATVISRLRAKLKPGGLQITSAKGSGSYRLVGPAADHLGSAAVANEPEGSGDIGRETALGGLSSLVDAFKFESLRQEGQARLDDGQHQAALEYFRDAARLWRGEPFDTGGRSWELPGACASFRTDLRRQRVSLVRTVAETALRLGRYDDAGFLRGHPVSGGLEDADELWLLDLLRTLRLAGTAAAERLIEARQPGSSFAPVVDRALDLLALHRAGVDVHHPLNGTAGQPDVASPPVLIGRQAEMSALQAMLTRVAGGQPAMVRLTGQPGTGKTRLLELRWPTS